MFTIYDIAKKAGVSATTVSRVINNYPDVSKKTREKILKTMEELEYIPSPSARSLSTKKSYLIGVLFSETLGVGIEHPYFAGVIESFKKRMELEGYDTIFITGKLGKKEIGYLQHCKYRQVDGIYIVTGLSDEEKLIELLDSDINCVTTDMEFEGVPRICSDNENGSIQVVNYFFNQGYDEIAFISGPLTTLSGRERYEGLLKGFVQHKKMFNQNHFYEAYEYCMEAGYEAARALYEQLGKSNFPKCVFAASDTLAVGVIRYFKEQGLEIPTDIKIIGYDNIDLAYQITPTLSTIAQDRKRIGELVAETLLKKIEGEQVAHLQQVAVQLILRETT